MARHRLEPKRSPSEAMALASENYGLLVVAVRKTIRDRHNIDDFLQTAWFDLYRAAELYDPCLSGWLVRIARAGSATPVPYPRVCFCARGRVMTRHSVPMVRPPIQRMQSVEISFFVSAKPSGMPGAVTASPRFNSSATFWLSRRSCVSRSALAPNP